jgi:hypothetical protein
MALATGAVKPKKSPCDLHGSGRSVFFHGMEEAGFDRVPGVERPLQSSARQPIVSNKLAPDHRV